MNFKKIILFSVILATIISCKKTPTLHPEFIVTDQAGVYSLNNITVSKYVNGVHIKDSSVNVGTSTFILKAVEGSAGSSFYLLDIYGNYTPDFLNHPGAFGWRIEYDSKRITFGNDDPSIGFTPNASLTVDNMGKSTQAWHQIISYTQNGKDYYYHKTFNLIRK
ncbi:MAG: hypothetical protein JSU07_04790 [Bacteroidetes bacterium]|nr:hypothetical protein [Bacteroidota bacterium]